MDPASAHAEYIGATLIGRGPRLRGWPTPCARPSSAIRNLYYEDGYQYLDHGEDLGLAPLPASTAWVEVDDHADLARAREIACHY